MVTKVQATTIKLAFPTSQGYPRVKTSSWMQGWSERHVASIRSSSSAKETICLHRLVWCIVFFLAFVGGVPAVVGQTTYLAENATLFGASLNSGNSGYTGIGYANFNAATGDYVEFPVIANPAGTYPITFRYANGSAGDRPLQLSVNGVVAIGSLSVPVTGSWTT